MANTYTQLHIQAVFAVQNRRSLIHPEWKDELYQYITGIIQNRDHKLLAINGISDHIHIFFGLRPHQSISDLMKEVKIGSMNWVNNAKLTKSEFYWQDGYGAFSYSRSQVSQVIRYIEMKEHHHQKKTFIQEYKEMLEKFQVPYNERYIFKEI